MRHVNFLYPEAFEYKFKRKPKEWTLEELHDLYLRTKERAEKRWNHTLSIIDTIDKEIPKFDRRFEKKSQVYFYQITNDKNTYTKHLRQYEFTWGEDKSSYTYSLRDPKLNTREERLDFALSNERSFELGQKFFESKKLEDMAWRTMWYIKDVFWTVLEKKLRDIYKGKKIRETLLIEVSGYKYFIHVKNGYGYPSFTLQNEFDGEIVKIS